VRHALQKWQVPPELLDLEITESVIMEDPRRALDIVTELDSMGVSISIDDFGTGYSSLSYLKKLPADELKIDKSFVIEMDASQDDCVIVRSIIEMAHNLGLRVVAEGVETQAIWQRLRALRCDYGQGFLFSRPMPSDRALHWLRAARQKPEVVYQAAAEDTGEAAPTAGSGNGSRPQSYPIRLSAIIESHSEKPSPDPPTPTATPHATTR
jgi:EAL domain-containing protein (putative c-di-GMP-specific phosphodiesterase class I)